MTPVVILHGWGMNASVFDDLAQRLSPACEVHAPDLSGYNGTAACEPYTLERLAAHAAHSAPARCAVVGWSLGAQIALTWARMNPQQVDRLVLVGATPSFVRRHDWTAGIDKPVLRTFCEALDTDREGTLRRFISLQAHGDVAQKRVIQCLRAALMARGTPEVAVLQRGLTLLLETDLRGDVRTLQHDTLLIHGEHDQLVPLAAAQRLARSIDQARLSVIRGAAHAPFVSDPETVSRVMLDFLQ